MRISNPWRPRTGAASTGVADTLLPSRSALSGINSQGINSFTWIVHSFTVLEASLLQLSPPPPSSAAGSAASAPAVASRKARLALQRQLTQLISHLSSSLSALQSSVEDTIPLASRASALGGRLQEEFLVERLTLEESLAGEPVWAPLLSHAQKAVGRLKDGGAGSDEPGAFRRDIVKRDLRLASETVGRLRDIRRGMEDVREELVGYRDNVGASFPPPRPPPRRVWLTGTISSVWLPSQASSARASSAGSPAGPRTRTRLTSRARWTACGASWAGSKARSGSPKAAAGRAAARGRCSEVSGSAWRAECAGEGRRVRGRYPMPALSVRSHVSLPPRGHGFEREAGGDARHRQVWQNGHGGHPVTGRACPG